MMVGLKIEFFSIPLRKVLGIFTNRSTLSKKGVEKSKVIVVIVQVIGFEIQFGNCDFRFFESLPLIWRLRFFQSTNPNSISANNFCSNY